MDNKILWCRNVHCQRNRCHEKLANEFRFFELVPPGSSEEVF